MTAKHAFFICDSPKTTLMKLFAVRVFSLPFARYSSVCSKITFSSTYRHIRRHYNIPCVWRRMRGGRDHEEGGLGRRRVSPRLIGGGGQSGARRQSRPVGERRRRRRRQIRSCRRRSRHVALLLLRCNAYTYTLLIAFVRSGIKSRPLNEMHRERIR